MQTKKLASLILKEPFRPFRVRLSNGATYNFDEPRQFGAPENLHVIFHFTEDDFTMIDTEKITEVTQLLPGKK